MTDELSRDEFIAMMVEQLRLNEEMTSIMTDCDGNRVMQMDDMEEIGRKCFVELGYDFPLVSEQQVESLVKVLQEKLNGEGLPKWFWLSPKVMEGVRYCLFDRNKAETPDRTYRALAALNVVMTVQVLEYLLMETTPVNTRRYLLMYDMHDEYKDVEKFEERFMKQIEKVTYHHFGILQQSDWNDLQVTATLFRLARSILKMDEDANLFDQHSPPTPGWVQELKATWPQYMLILRDRITDKPESIKTTLPALLDMTSICYQQQPFESSMEHSPKSQLQIRGNLVLIGMLSSLCEGKSLQRAGVQERALFWDLIDKTLLSQLSQMVIDKLNTHQHEEIMLSEDFIKHILNILEVYGAGDPRKSFSFQTSTDVIARKGVIRAIVNALLKGCNTLPKMFPLPSAVDPHEQHYRFALDFLFICCVRAKSVLSFVTMVPGFRERLLSPTVLDVDKIKWAFLISMSTLENKKDFQEMTESYLDLINCAQLDMSKVKFVVDLVSGLDNPDFIRHLHYWHETPKLIRAFKRFVSNLKSLSKPPKETQLAAEDQHEEDPAKKREDDLAIQDRLVRARQLVKRFLGRLEDTGNKAD